MSATTEQIAKLKDPLLLKWRVKDLLPDNVNPKLMVLVGYVDARQVEDRFDEAVGPANWQDDYFECKNKQFCRIGIKVNGEWIWKGDSGSESFLDPGKGETSDSFKRAAVHWGVNRDTYELGEVTINCKLVNGIPVPCDGSGNTIRGSELLNECKRISALNDSELIFDKMVLPANVIEAKANQSKASRKARKPKIILP